MDLTPELISRHFKNLVPQNNLIDLADDAARFRVFDPLTTLYYYLQQVLTSSSCKTVLGRLNIERIKKNQKPVSMCSSAFTRAKSRLSENKLFKLATDTGRKIDKMLPQWKWKGREVYFADGTILTLPDLEKNRIQYPKATYKGIEVGFPKMRLLGLFSASTGAFIDGEVCAYSGKGTAEPTLLLKLLDRITSNSILVLDRFFTSLSLQAILQDYGIDYVIRARDNFAKKHLGRKKDKVITLKKSCYKGSSIYLGMDHKEMITLRILKSSIKRSGFRDKSIFIITSLIAENKIEIEKIYLQRWNVELDIRNLKTTMESDHLKAKCPAGARKELWVRLLGYNLVRNLTVQCSLTVSTDPRKRSFKLALKMYIELIKIRNNETLLKIFNLLGEQTLKSKYRREARAIKKRRNSYPLLTTTRKQAKKQSWGYSRRRPTSGPSIEYGALNAVA